MTQLSAVSQKSDSGDKSDTIKVGVLLSTTGDFSISETPMKNCAQMAIDEINEKGGINGKRLRQSTAITVQTLQWQPRKHRNLY